MGPSVRTILCALLLLTACKSAPVREGSTSTRIRILHTNDEHSRLVPFSAEGDPELGGVLAREWVLRQLRDDAAGAPAFLLSGGDYAQGTLTYDVWEGSAEVMAMNALGYDAITLGNHQFDLGPASLGRSLAGGSLKVNGEPRVTEPAAMPVVVSNLSVESEPALRSRVVPRAVLERGGVRLGIVGAITETLPRIVEIPSNLRVLDTVSTVQAQVDALTRAGIDKILLLSHSSTDVDLANVAKLSGVDVVVAGHDHALFGDAQSLQRLGIEGQAKKVKHAYPMVARGKDGAPVLIVSSGEFGRFVGKLDIEFDAQGRITKWSGEPVPVRCAPTCPATNGPLAQKLSEYLKPVDALSNRVLTHTQTPMKPAQLADTMADAMLESARGSGAVAALAQGDLRGSFAAGDVTYGAAYALWPFNTRIFTARLSGEELHELLEGWLRAEPTRPGLSGLRAEFTPSPKPTLRSLRIANEAVVPSRQYVLAVDGYVASMSGLAVLERVCARGDCQDTQRSQRQAWLELLAKKPALTPADGDRLIEKR